MPAYYFLHLLLKVAAFVAGELEVEAVKLDFERLAELMTVRLSSTHVAWV